MGSEAAIPNDRMMTLREVARVLTISEPQAYKLAKEGGLPFPGVRVGDRWRFSPTLVARYLHGLEA